MTFLPIVTRELRVSARRRSTYWSRAVTAVAAIIVGAIVYFNVRDTAPKSAGMTLFEVVSWLAFVYCIVVGIRATADCLSEEKRDGTLGLLFLTDLKGYDVVGGKLVATSLNAFYGLIAIFPVLAIPLLMGGITNGEFWRRALVLANTFLFSLSIGMFMSSISKSPRKSMAGTFVLLLFFTIGLIICDAYFIKINRSHDLHLLCYLLNPGSAFVWAPDLAYAREAQNFWWSTGMIHGLCWLLLGLACFIVPRSWQDKTPGAGMRRWSAAWRKWNFGGDLERLVFRRRLLDINAFYWLAGRVRLKPVHVWFTLGCAAGLWLWGAWENGRGWNNDMVYILTALALNTMLKLWIASEAGRRLGEERKMGSLELILSTPLSVPEILRGQWLALRRQFLAPLIAVLIVECVFLVASLQGSSTQAENAPAYLAFWSAGMFLLVADVLALCPVSMWVSLTTRNPNRTTGITVARVLVLPLAIGFGILIFTLMFQVMGSRYGGFEPGWKFFLALWFVPGILADLVFGLSSWRRLHTQFREVATQRYSQPVSLFRRLFGRREGPAAPLPASSSAEPA